MTAHHLSRTRREAGFSLLEVVIAAGLLLLTVTSVTAAVTSVSHAGRRADAAMRVDGALDLEISRLASLPFCAAGLPAVPAGDPAAATDLVAAVFPDAGAPRDSASAWYAGTDSGGIPAGAFFTRLDREGVLITCVARFRRHAEEDWLGPADLAGWDLAESRSLPAPLLVVEVTAAAGGVLRSGRLVREAGVDQVPVPQSATLAGP